MAHIDPFINITRGLNRLENHFTGGTPLNNPTNIIQGIRGSLNTVRHNYQSAYQDIDGVIAQRDNRDAQIVQLQQDVNLYRQQNIALQNQVNQLTQERDTFQAQVFQQHQNLGLLNQQNIGFQRQIEDIEKSRNF